MCIRLGGASKSDLPRGPPLHAKARAGLSRVSLKHAAGPPLGRVGGIEGKPRTMSATKTDSDSVMQHRVNAAITAMEGTILTNLFGTPLMVHKWANSTALNSELRDAILRFETKAQSMPRTNVGGVAFRTGKAGILWSSRGNAYRTHVRNGT